MSAVASEKVETRWGLPAAAHVLGGHCDTAQAVTILHRLPELLDCSQETRKQSWCWLFWAAPNLYRKGSSCAFLRTGDVSKLANLGLRLQWTEGQLKSLLKSWPSMGQAKCLSFSAGPATPRNSSGPFPKFTLSYISCSQVSVCQLCDVRGCTSILFS